MEYHLIVRTRLDKWRNPWTIAWAHLPNRITEVSQEHRLWTEILPVCQDNPLLAEPDQCSNLFQVSSPPLAVVHSYKEQRYTSLCTS